MSLLDELEQESAAAPSRLDMLEQEVAAAPAEVSLGEVEVDVDPAAGVDLFSEEPAPEAAPVAAPEVEIEVAPEAAPRDEEGFIMGALDTLAGIPRGAIAAIEEGGNNLGNLAEATLGIPSGPITFDSSLMDVDDEYFTWLTQDEAKERGYESEVFGKVGSDDNFLGEARTTAGRVSTTMSKFVSGMLMMRTAAGSAGLSVNGVGSTMAQSAVVDGMFTKARGKRLSNLMQENEWLANPLSEYLADDGDDSAVEGMLKNTLEGAAIGLPLEAAMKLFRGYKAANRMTEAAGDVHMRDVVEPDVRASLAAAIEKQGDDVTAEAVAMSHRNAARAAKAEQPTVDMAKLQDTLSASRAGDDVLVPNDTFNWSRIDAAGSVEDTLKAVTQTMDAQVGRWSREGTYSFEQMTSDAVTDLARVNSDNPREMLEAISASARNSESQVSEMLAGKMMLKSLGEEVSKLSKAVEMGDDVGEEFMSRVAQLAELSSHVKDITRSAARVTAAGRIRTLDLGDAAAVVEAAKNGGRKLTTEEIHSMALRVRALEGNVAGVIGVAKETESIARRGVRILNEVYINSLLSGLGTHAVNAGSNAAKMVVTPLEKTLGGIMMGSKDMTTEGGRQMLNLLSSAPESMRLAAAAFKQADNILDPAVRTIEDTKDAITMAGNSPAAMLVNAIGTVTRMPSRLLLTSDELFKQMTYRSALTARLQTDAMQKWPGRGADIANQRAIWVAEEFKKGFGTDGVGSNATALNDARSATFTTPLNEQGRSNMTGLVSDVSTLVNKWPALRQFVPFIRTPWNLITDVAVRTPGLAHTSTAVREALKSSDPRVVAKAKGQLATGSAAITTALLMATNGKLTGEGPRSPAMRARWEATGWRPNSIVIDNDDGTKDYLSYNRADPFGMFFGMVANFNEVGGEMAEGDRDEMGVELLVSTIKTLSSKTFLTGINGLMKAIAEPDRNLESFVRKQVSGYAPSFLMSAANLTDDVVGTDIGDSTRRLSNQGLLDGFRARVPGWSNDLPARYDFVTGEEVERDRGDGDWFGSINPAIRSTNEGDPVLQELVDVGAKWGAPARQDDEYVFTADEYETYQRLIHQPSRDTMPLKEALGLVIASPSYQSLSPAATGNDMGAPERLDHLDRVVSRYRQIAKKQMAKKFPDTYGNYKVGARRAAKELTYAATEEDAQAVKAKFKEAFGSK